ADKDWKGESQPFSVCVKSWYEAGARLIGGCCRTTPEDIKGIAALRQALLKPL
ncbi:MAG: homocysteine S-methyltransferase family protein, partial [Acidaminococcaceae bacterium]|nr:homocysteine S-methyltransferase family protein [Acidaminococcaceae bacterium]